GEDAGDQVQRRVPAPGPEDDGLRRRPVAGMLRAPRAVRPGALSCLGVGLAPPPERQVAAWWRGIRSARLVAYGLSGTRRTGGPDDVRRGAARPGRGRGARWRAGRPF